jgi:hypothetical protein
MEGVTGMTVGPAVGIGEAVGATPQPRVTDQQYYKGGTVGMEAEAETEGEVTGG